VGHFGRTVLRQNGGNRLIGRCFRGKMVGNPVYRGQEPSAMSPTLEDNSPSGVEIFTNISLCASLKPFVPDNICPAHFSGGVPRVGYTLTPPVTLHCSSASPSACGLYSWKSLRISPLDPFRVSHTFSGLADNARSNEPR